MERDSLSAGTSIVRVTWAITPSPTGMEKCSRSRPKTPRKMTKAAFRNEKNSKTKHARLLRVMEEELADVCPSLVAV